VDNTIVTRWLSLRAYDTFTFVVSWTMTGLGDWSLDVAGSQVCKMLLTSLHLVVNYMCWRHVCGWRTQW